MAQITITEALAEYTTIQKRIAKKEETVIRFLFRQEKLKDPLGSEENGTAGYLKREMQSIDDLRERLILIRREINKKNLETNIEIKGRTRSMADWITWKDKIVKAHGQGYIGHGQFLANIQATIDSIRKQAQQKNVRVVASSDQAEVPDDVIINIDQIKLTKDREEIEEILGILDGQLSLKNATVTIDLP